MRFSIPFFLAMLWLGVTAPMLAAQTRPFCANMPQQSWISTQDVEARINAAGYRLKTLRVTPERCYVLETLDMSGAEVTLVMHPITATILDKSSLP